MFTPTSRPLLLESASLDYSSVASTALFARPTSHTVENARSPQHRAARGAPRQTRLRGLLHELKPYCRRAEGACVRANTYARDFDDDDNDESC